MEVKKTSISSHANKIQKAATEALLELSAFTLCPLCRSSDTLSLGFRGFLIRAIFALFAIISSYLYYYNMTDNER